MKQTFIVLSLLIIKNSFAADVACTANNLTTWKACKTQLERKLITKIVVDGTIKCPEKECNLSVKNATAVTITSNSGAEFIRSSGFDAPLMSFNGVKTLSLSNITVLDPANIPEQPTKGASEVNRYCKTFKNKRCAASLSIYNSGKVTVSDIGIYNGKLFGLSLVGNEDVTLKNSFIDNAFWFGVWGGQNKLLKVLNNTFSKNRSNGILMSFANSVSTQITGNRFVSNHRATAFHSCGDGNDPCPGGQIDLSGGAQNVLIQYNIFENGAMSNEFPEDAQNNWISGIEFEPHAGDIKNVVINNNDIRNNSGSPFFVNSPDKTNTSFDINLRYVNNRICNNRTSNNYPSSFKWTSGIIQSGNVTNCDDDSDAKGSILIGSTPCIIPPGASTCSATVKWSTAYAPRACIFLKGSRTLFACGPHGTQGASWIQKVPVTFELHASRNYFSKLLGSATVKPRVVVPGTPFITLAGRGCDKNQCIWAKGYNMEGGCTATLYAADWSKRLASVTKTVCQGNLMTFEVPSAILKSYPAINFHIVNKNGKWSAPYLIKFK